MKILLIALLLGFAWPTVSSASCGSPPQAPALLEQTQLGAQQLETLSPLIEAYFESVHVFKACIDQKIAQIAPADAPLDFFDSPEYQAQFDGLTQISELAQTRMNQVVARYNYLVETSNRQ